MGRSDRDGSFHQSPGQQQVGHRGSSRLEVSLRKETEAQWAAPDGGFETGVGREAASDAGGKNNSQQNLHGHREVSITEVKKPSVIKKWEN